MGVDLPVTAEAIESDPYLTFEPDDAGVWTIRERDGGHVYASPLDAPGEGRWADVAYVGRLKLRDEDRVFLVIAGVHALGSVGAVDYLARHLPELYAQLGTRRFSTPARSSGQCTKLRARSHECVMVTSTSAGLQAAKTAAVPAIYYPGMGATSDPEPPPEATTIVTSMAEITAILAANNRRIPATV